MNVTLYNFSKRANSTKRPNGNAKGISGTLKMNTSMLAPTIGFNFGTSDSPKNYNYAYIPDFGRFYFINDWIWDTGLWYASLTVDPLATWRSEIAGSKEYILRAANAYDGNVVDMTYPTFAGCNIASFNIMDIFSDNVNAGTFIMSVQAKGNLSKFGTNTTIACTPDAMRKFAKLLLQNTDYLQIDPNEISDNLSKALFNPIQYISYILWLPISVNFNSTYALEKVPLGWWDFDAGTGFYILDQNNDSVEHIETITIPKHPQVDDKHYYLKNSPYSEYKIYMPGFGLIDIDSAKLYNVDKLKLSLKVDLYTGNMTLQLMNGNNPFQTLTGCCAVQSQIGQIASPVNLGGLTQSVIGGAVAGAKSFFDKAKDITAKLHAFINGADNVGLDTNAASIANDIQSGAQQATAESTTKGGQGSVVEYSINPYIIAKFNRIVEQTPETRGYPVCRLMQISSLKGFIMCADSDFTAPATSEEISAVKAHMNAGFYFE